MSIFKQMIGAPLLKAAMYASLTVLVALNVFLLSPPHPPFELERIPGFWAIFGLGGAVALTILAKGAAHTFLGRDVDFYEKRENKASASLKEVK